MLNIQEIFEHLWTDYVSLNPEALRIHRLLSDQHETILNDHVAFRTFNTEKLGVNSLAKTFLDLGYKECGQYTFVEKKLFAKHFEHPDTTQPKIFISELELEKMSPFVKDTLLKCVNSIPDATVNDATFLFSGTHWTKDFKTYENLYKESEYAAWVYAFGFRANHFTVNVNALKKFNDLPKLNHFIKTNGFQLNQAGGEIKGTPEEFLQQSSTMAKEIEVEFSDGRKKVPACYYEFAKRYLQSNGKLYQGFIAKSADKIFESTNRS